MIVLAGISFFLAIIGFFIVYGLSKTGRFGDSNWSFVGIILLGQLFIFCLVASILQIKNGYNLNQRISEKLNDSSLVIFKNNILLSKDSTALMVNELKKIRSLDYNHSNDIGKLDIALITGKDSINLRFSQDIRNENKYWIYSFNRHDSSYSEVGEIVTKSKIFNVTK